MRFIAFSVTTCWLETNDIMPQLRRTPKYSQPNLDVINLSPRETNLGGFEALRERKKEQINKDLQFWLQQTYSVVYIVRHRLAQWENRNPWVFLWTDRALGGRAPLP